MKRWVRLTLFGGAGLFVLSLPIGLGGTFWGLRGAFNSASEAAASEKAELLASGVDLAMTSTFVGIALAVVGAIAFIAGLVGHFSGGNTAGESSA